MNWKNFHLIKLYLICSYNNVVKCITTIYTI